MNTHEQHRYDIALEIATAAHLRQAREGGEPYITHPIAVAALLEDPEDKVVALLHDTVEDNPTVRDVIEDHIRQHLGASTLLTVLELTKLAGENYYQFILRIMHGSDRAVRVKLADITHNLSDAKPGSRADKYRLALHILTSLR